MSKSKLISLGLLLILLIIFGSLSKINAKSQQTLLGSYKEKTNISKYDSHLFLDDYNYLIEINFKNNSDDIVIFNIKNIKLIDKKGYNYKVKTGVIKGKFETYGFLLPGENFSHILPFKKDKDIESDVISLSLENKETQFFEKDNKQYFNTNKNINSINEKVSKNGLEISLEKIEKTANKLISTLKIKNTTSSSINLRFDGLPLSAPYIKDKFGQYLEKDNPRKPLPKTIRSNSVIRIKDEFYLNNTTPPYYYYIQHYKTNFSIENKYIWKIPKENNN